MAVARIHNKLVKLPSLVTEPVQIEYPDEWKLVCATEHYSKLTGPHLSLFFLEEKRET